MRRVAAVVAVLMGLWLVPPPPAGGDELLEAARKERERREALKKKREKTRAEDEPDVLSNRDLKRSAGNVSTVTPHTGSDAPAAEPAAGAAETPAEQTEKHWREKLGEAQKQVDDRKRELQELIARIADLRRMSSAADDPVVRYRTAQELRESEAKVAAGQKAVADAEKGVAGVREEARRAGVPAGWVR